MPPPARPRLVLITIAPFAASMPYSAAASGPFNTVSVSMSCEFRSAARLVKSTPRLLNAVTELLSDASTPVLTVRLSIGRPSTMISGWLLLLIELTPRMTRDEEAPGTPDVLVTLPVIVFCCARRGGATRKKTINTRTARVFIENPGFCEVERRSYGEDSDCQELRSPEARREPREHWGLVTTRSRN